MEDPKQAPEFKVVEISKEELDFPRERLEALGTAMLSAVEDSRRRFFGENLVELPPVPVWAGKVETTERPISASPAEAKREFDAVFSRIMKCGDREMEPITLEQVLNTQYSEIGGIRIQTAIHDFVWERFVSNGSRADGYTMLTEVISALRSIREVDFEGAGNVLTKCYLPQQICVQLSAGLSTGVARELNSRLYRQSLYTKPISIHAGIKRAVEVYGGQDKIWKQRNERTFSLDAFLADSQVANALGSGDDADVVRRVCQHGGLAGVVYLDYSPQSALLLQPLVALTCALRTMQQLEDGGMVFDGMVTLNIAARVKRLREDAERIMGSGNTQLSQIWNALNGDRRQELLGRFLSRTVK